MNNKDRAKKIKSILGLRGKDTDKEYYRVADVICDLRHFVILSQLILMTKWIEQKHFMNKKRSMKK
ncbi:MAG: hypothetical protein CM15mV49_340 [uncultured marine virus]|nr:MAG: hypothetical protein CM15mV49_340 [uncultured marine virus]